MRSSLLYARVYVLLEIRSVWLDSAVMNPFVYIIEPAMKMRIQRLLPTSTNGYVSVWLA